jgi:hypothetical protein
MARSNYLIVSGPIDVTDGLCVVFDFLKKSPRIDIREVVNFVDSGYVILFSGNNTIVSLLGEC